MNSDLFSIENKECYWALNPKQRHLSEQEININISDSNLQNINYYTFENLLNEICCICPSDAAFTGSSYEYIVVSHEGSKTGAPVVCSQISTLLPGRILLISFGQNQEVFQQILGKENLEYVHIPLTNRRVSVWGNILGGYLQSKGLTQSTTTVISSTIECSSFSSGLTYATGCAGVTLLHEHSQYYDAGSALRMFFCSQRVIYTSEYVKKSWVRLLKAANINPRLDDYFVKLPQPLQGNDKTYSESPRLKSQESLQKEKSNTLFICAGGHLQPRKGVHLYINLCDQIAANLNHFNSEYHRIHVYWIGYPDIPTEYSEYIKALINDCSKRHHNITFELIGLTDEYLNYFEYSDICICPSTIDPLPNIVYDIFSIQKPVLIFRDCNGHEEIFKKIGCDHFLMDKDNINKSAIHILENLDTILNYKNNQQLSKQFFSCVPTAQEYSKELVQTCNEARQSRKVLLTTPMVLDQTWINPDVYLNYLDTHPAFNYPFELVYKSLGHWNIYFHWCNPCDATLKFMSFLFKSNLNRYLNLKNNSLQVLGSANLGNNDNSTQADEKFDLHIHAFYPDIAQDLLLLIHTTQAIPNFIHITSQTEAMDTRIKQVLKSNFPDVAYKFYKTKNIGRNIYPLLEIAGNCTSEYVLHMHTKASVHTSNDIITRWIKYLECLLIFPQEKGHINKVVNAMKKNNLSIAYPLDPNKQELGINALLITELVSKLLQEKFAKDFELPQINYNDAFPYPCGFMMYFTTKYLKQMAYFLKPLLNEDNCKEPLAYDGTILHAIERFVPLFMLINNQNIGLLRPRMPIYR